MVVGLPPETDCHADIDALAEACLDLWQKQWAAAITDPALTEAVVAGLHVANAFVKTFAEQARSGDATKKPDNGKGETPSGITDPDLSVTYGDHDGRYREFFTRISALEQRISTLESLLLKRRRANQSSPRRSRAGRV